MDTDREAWRVSELPSDWAQSIPLLFPNELTLYDHYNFWDIRLLMKQQSNGPQWIKHNMFLSFEYYKKSTYWNYITFLFDMTFTGVREFQLV